MAENRNSSYFNINETGLNEKYLLKFHFEIKIGKMLKKNNFETYFN